MGVGAYIVLARRSYVQLHGCRTLQGLRADVGGLEASEGLSKRLRVAAVATQPHSHASKITARMPDVMA